MTRLQTPDQDFQLTQGDMANILWIFELCIVLYCIIYCIMPSHAQWVHKGKWDMIVTEVPS